MAVTRLVVGLGNPGDDYRRTRHNLGFLAVERLARSLGIPGEGREECRSFVVEAGEALLVEPQTYMNRSGAAVRCLAERHAVAPDRILVLYDEVHLPLGRIRMRPGGSPAGHRGMESIVEALGTEEVPRIRLGVGPAPAGAGEEGLAGFVLAPFLAEEAEAVESICERAAAAVRVWIESGIELAMNRANAPAPETPPPTADLPRPSPAS